MPIDDDTVLEAIVLEAKRVTKNFKDDAGNFVEKVQFTFQVTEDGPFYGRRLRGETSIHFNSHARCKLRAWVQEILALDLAPGFRFNTEEVQNLPVRVVVGKKVSPRKDGQGDWADNFVKDVMRVANSAASRDVITETESF